MKYDFSARGLKFSAMYIMYINIKGTVLTKPLQEDFLDLGFRFQLPVIK